MMNDDVDVDPENPDSVMPPVFVPSDRRKFNHNNPKDVMAHDAALAAFEARERERTRIENANRNALLERTRFGITRKVCSPDCTCSYCGNNGYDKGMKPGLNIPKQWWVFNSWWVWRRDVEGSNVVYYCCTPFSFLRKPQLALRDAFKWTM
jgi:hypothetical protein